ncbi:MAG: AAA family ATPase [Oscillospiraceae bacterium]|jgi:predicted ATP-dependent endonuclease of OLD family|nr:AAA family ATPase [Oscillospiraceae bacterium]
MQITKISIKNFRRLKDITIDFCEKTTLFVGANNSGKTSAMDALRKFLIKGDKNGFVYNDIPVTNRVEINNLGENWVLAESDLQLWLDIFPTMDVWLNVKENEYHYVSSIIPTLEWNGGDLGLRLALLPKDIHKLREAYTNSYNKARNTEKSNENSKVNLFPNNLGDFIARYIGQYFELKSFILDPSKINVQQTTDFSNECIDKNPLSSIIKIDMITAQRGLSDADSTNDVVSLSGQLRTYYDKHLDVEKNTSPEDLETLFALSEAKKAFNGTLKIKFESSLDELSQLGFPGISDPKITIEANLQEKTAFQHESAVIYSLSDEDKDLRLPEKYNGLGYQNLIAIAFKLMSFRDDRIHKGKAKSEDSSEIIAPLHLVLLEEPEAHLHVQVQQVLIKKAYEILTNDKILQEENFHTQLIVSTHSSHIAKEMSFSNIRYFRRERVSNNTPISFSEVINLTDTFGEDKNTEKFVQRYLSVLHCDLFFADAVIFVEGTSENVLVPYFIRSNSEYNDLDSRYVTILPVGGSHSHRFKPLIEKIGIYTLVITDIDTAKQELRKNKNGKDKTVTFSTQPVKEQSIITSNSSIAEWGITEKEYDKLLKLSFDSKVFAGDTIRIAYQTPQEITVNGEEYKALAATFEDSLVYANMDIIKNLGDIGITKKLKADLNKASGDEICKSVYNTIHNNKDSKNDKVSFALDMIYADSLKVPNYIAEGLNWLQDKLKRKDSEVKDDGK